LSWPRWYGSYDAIESALREAGHVNPAEGLEQFRNVSRGATFNGAHRARTNARNAGSGPVPHPGYDAADYNRLTRAMTADLKNMVRMAAHGTAADKAAAVAGFEEAERSFGPLSELNGRLNRLLHAQGGGAISTLLQAAEEQGGGTRLLAQLQRSMPAAEFQHIGGQLLYELGHQPATGEFSLAKFVTEFEKLSPRARGILFEPNHLRDIENIVQMGRHIKGALKESSTSHSANLLVLLDLAKDPPLLPHDIANQELPPPGP